MGNVSQALKLVLFTDMVFEKASDLIQIFSSLSSILYSHTSTYELSKQMPTEFQLHELKFAPNLFGSITPAAIQVQGD